MRRLSAFVVLAALLGGAGNATAQQPSRARQDARWDFVLEDRPSLRFGDSLRIDLTTLVDAEWRRLGEDGELDADLGRRRVGLEGRVFDVFEFEVEREFGDEHDPWRDVLLEFRKYRALRIRGGHFKIPFGAERLASIRGLELVRRSVLTETLTPGRDTGVQLSGRVFGDAVGYMAGAFRRDGSGLPRDGEPWAGGHTVAARVVVAPFSGLRNRTLRRIETGGGYTRGSVSEGLNGPVLRTVSGFEAFEPMYVAGTRQRFGLDANFSQGPFSVRGEYLRSWDERAGQSLTGDDLPDLVGHGWQVTGAFIAIGDLRDGGTTPRDPLFRGGAGAIQLAGRFETLDFTSAAPWDEAFRNPRAANVLPNGFRAWTAGINWYPVRHLKLQLNLIGERLDDPERRPDPGRAWATSRVFRVQFSL